MILTKRKRGIFNDVTIIPALRLNRILISREGSRKTSWRANDRNMIINAKCAIDLSRGMPFFKSLILQSYSYTLILFSYAVNMRVYSLKTDLLTNK